MPFESFPRRLGRSESECLESRFLLSAVIAVSPVYQDATQAIQNALNSAGGGGTVNLAPGSYNVSSQLTIPSGVRLEGAGNATLNWTGGGMGNLLYSPWYSVGTTVDGVTLNGAGYKIDPDGANITVSNNTFENVSYADPYYGNGLYIPDVETGTIISGNTFTNITGNLGIYIFNPIDTQIVNNTFTNDSEAIKGQWGNAGSNDSISNNTLSGIYRFGIECQGNPTNLTVSGNTLGNWQQRDSHIGLSIATGQGNGINITGNIILGTGITTPNTAYTAIEAMGDNLTIANNFASGWGWAQLVGFTDHWVTENNTWGINTAAWVLENGGINPSIDTGNTLVALNTQPSGTFSTDAAPAPAPTPAPAPAPVPAANTTAPATTSAPQPTAPATTATASTTTATTSDPSPPAAAPFTQIVANPIFGPAAAPAPVANSPATSATPTPAIFSNDLYSVWSDGSGLTNAGNGSTFACQTASSGTLTLLVHPSAKPSSGNANLGITIRSSLRPGAARLSLKSASSTTTRKLRTSAGLLYLRLERTGGSIQGSYSTDGTTFTPIATVQLSA